MVKEAASHAGEDQERREKIEKHNQLDSMIYQAEKTIGESAEKLGDVEKTALQDAIGDAKKDLESDDAARIDAARQRLETELHKVAEVLYKVGAEESGDQAEAASHAEADDDVIDAEYTEEKGDS